MNNLYTTITSCRSCGSDKLSTVLDLDNLYISDFILPGEDEVQAPLELVMCEECSLVQLRHTVDRDRLYRDKYMYRSSTNETMVTALKDVVDDAMSRVMLYPGDKILDIGCNDGTLLSMYPRLVDTYGYEPAWNLWEIAKKKTRGCIYPTYFPREIIIHDKYKIITSIAQFYNSNDLNGYVSTIKKILKPDGVWIVQMQDLEGMVGCNGFDNLCHEHLTYFSQEAFMRLLDRHGLYVCDCSHNSTNGNSVRYVIKHGQRQGRMEDDWSGRLRVFKNTVHELKIDTVNLLHQLKLEGKSVVGIAASTKANTLLQYYGITPDLLPAIADRNEDKVGKVTVGTHIPIISERELYERKPDVLVPLAWHFLDSFISRYDWFNGDWIIPLPELRVIHKERDDSIVFHEQCDKLLFGVPHKMERGLSVDTNR